MKFTLYLKDETGREWCENYDENTMDAFKWAENVVENFNKTLRPFETKRTLIKVVIDEDGNKSHHEWVKRTDGMSVVFRGSVADLMYCKKCGITGKRYGVRSKVKIDSKYRKKAFKYCDTAKAELLKAQKGE